jgi:squalene-hopene/tetraprenyl-beta-curcumene cyclase
MRNSGCDPSMNLQVDVERLQLAQKAVRAELLAERAAGGHWVGYVASSPFATAAAVSALVAAHHADTRDVLSDDSQAKSNEVASQVVQSDLCEFLIESVNWLASHQNADGGWGDCVGGKSTIAATLLVQAAFRLTGVPAKYEDLVLRADQFVQTAGGINALRREYREDKPLIAAVLATCALAGIVPWSKVPTLQFEQACMPKLLQTHLPLPFDATSLPLVLAIGRAKFQQDPPRNPVSRIWRRSMRTKSVAMLAQLQAADDSFLSSISTTAFVVLSLASTGCQNHMIVQRGVEYLLASVRGDASWPVVNDLATSITTQAITSFAHDTAASRDSWQDTALTDETVTDAHSADSPSHTSTALDSLAEINPFTQQCLDWLLACQRTEGNVLTGASPGGWASSDAPGALPNSINTADALLALACWPRFSDFPHRERAEHAARLGVTSLLDLQNDDGGWPTFYREPFGFKTDDSGVEATSRVLRALAAWQRHWRSANHRHADGSLSALTTRIDQSLHRGWQFLELAQRDDGRFVPQWFGNEHQLEQENHVIGTSEVLLAAIEVGRVDSNVVHRAARWLASAQHTSGGWGPPRAPLDYSGTDKDGFKAWRANEAMAKNCSVEETALAVEALLPLADTSPAIAKAASAGLNWLVNAVEQDAHRSPSVIGFYPSGIWYHERLYPLVFSAGAFSRATHRLVHERPAPATVS